MFPNFNPLFVLLGALLPDADIRTSYAGRFLPLWRFTRHRGILHSIWGLLFFSCLVGWVWDWHAGISLGIGYLIHLLMDAFNSIKWLGKRKKRAHK